MSEAVTFYSTAKGYVQSAFLLITNPLRFSVPDDLSFILAYHMLLGFAVELYLKAYLRAEGHLASELRSSSVRHNLGKLLKMAKQDGFEEAAADSLVQYLALQHGNFEYRYANPERDYYIRWIDEVFVELSKLDACVDIKVAASSSRGLKSGVGQWTIAPQFRGWRIPSGAAT